MARGSDIRLLGAIALGTLLLAGLGAAAKPPLTMDQAFDLVRDRVVDQVDGEYYWVPASPAWLEPIQGGVALVAAAGPLNCHMCRAEISVFYLRPSSEGWAVAGAWRKILEEGTWGKVGDIAPIDLGSGNPALSFTDGFMNEGCYLESLWVMELTPQRPIVRFGAPLMSDNLGEYGGADPRSFMVEATVSRLSDRPGLQIRYKGNLPHSRPVDRTVRYAGPGDTWWAKPGEFTDHCIFFGLFAQAISPGESVSD